MFLTKLYHRAVFKKFIELEKTPELSPTKVFNFYQKLENVLDELDKKHGIKNTVLTDLNTKPEQSKCPCTSFFKKNEFYVDAYSRWAKCLTKNNVCKPDLREAWESSRLQTLSKNCLAGTSRDCSEQILAWSAQNPFLTGPNWTCAMEVGIRAINIIIALACEIKMENKLAPEIKTLLWQHKKYIGQSLEYFDTPNNHLLCDLFGLLYLNLFFDRHEEAKQALLLLDQELATQVQADGSLGEGSTWYHRLVYEIVIHTQEVNHEFVLAPQINFSALEREMHQFLQATEHINFGDRDDGKIFTGIAEIKNACAEEESLLEFKNFGLVVVKTKNIAAAIKTGHNSQGFPSGHFHQNIFAIDLKIDSTNIFSNARTPFYTKSKPIRDFCRSANAYTTFGCSKWPEIAGQWPTFWSDLKISEFKTSVEEKANFIKVFSSFSSALCSKNQSADCCKLSRELLVKDFGVEIHDSFQCSQNCTPEWTFITPMQSNKEAQNYVLENHGKSFLFTVDPKLEFEENFVISSKKYGQRTWIKQLKSTGTTSNFMQATFGVKKV